MSPRTTTRFAPGGAQFHGARFDPATGKTISVPPGTCPHALMLPTEFEDGTLTYVYGE
jgi:nitrite reductase/ring-hydroxylating ferredoxin subunit